MSNIANAQGHYPTQWAADLLATNQHGNQTFVGRINSTLLPSSGMQRIRIRDTRTSNAGHLVRNMVVATRSMDEVHKIATETARRIIDGSE